MKRIYILLLAVVAPSLDAMAQQLTLQQCVDMAMGQNLSLKAAGKSVERAKALQGTAWDLEKTELSLSQDPTSGGSPDNALSLSQTIDFPTVYAARHGQLKAETKAEQSRERVLALQLSCDVASAYLQLVFLQERIRIIDSQNTLFARYADMASKRYKAGDARQLEVLTANRLLEENRQDLVSAKSELATQQMLLMSLLNTTSQVFPADTLLRPIDYRIGNYNYATTVEGQYAQDRLDVTAKALKVAKNGYAPSISLSLRNQLVITSWDPYHQARSRFDGGNFMGFEVGIGVPIFYGATKAKVKAAKKDREIAELEIKQEEAQRKMEYSACMSRYTSAFTRLAYYEKEGTERASELARLSTLEYENGEISYLEYVNALQESIDVRMKYAAVVNEFNQAVISLQRLTGTM